MIEGQEKDGENLTTLQPIPLQEDNATSEKSDSSGSDSENDQQGTCLRLFMWP